MDERRFRSIGVMIVLLAALVLNAGPLQRAVFDGADVEPALMRHVLVLSAGYVGIRVMEAIAFRPRAAAETAASTDTTDAAAMADALRVAAASEN